MHDETIPKLPRNEGGWDRATRILLGIAVFALGASGFFADPAGTVLRVVALVPIVTGVFGWCPLYAILGINTHRATG